MKRKTLSTLLSLSLISTAWCDPAPYEAIVDPHFSPFVGAEDMLILHGSLELGEDKCEIFKDKDALGKLGRLVELVGIWGPFNLLIDVTEHEVFGHGYRIRQLGSNVAEVHSYSVSLSGGATSFTLNPETSLGDYSAIVVAGLEAESILADSLKMKWALSKTCSARQESMYFQGKLSPLLYSLTLENPSVDSTLEGSFAPTVSGKPDLFTGHDIATYQYLMNSFYPGWNLSKSDLVKASLWNLADLTLYNGITSWFKYILTAEDASFWMIPITQDVRYLPSVSSVFAPYGIEYKVDNYLFFSKQLLTFYAKGGSAPGKTFGGGGFSLPLLIQNKYGRFGVCGDVWSQPNFFNTASVQDWEDSPSSDPEFPITGQFWGGRIGVSAHLNLLKNESLQFVTYTGYKTKGYLPGYTLNSGGYIRAGLGTHF